MMKRVFLVFAGFIILGLEADNNEDNPAWLPLTKPTISNVTIVGADGTNGVRLRNGTAGALYNVVVTAGEGYSNCLRVNGDESIANAEAGTLTVENSIVACEEDDIKPFEGTWAGTYTGGDTGSWESVVKYSSDDGTANIEHISSEPGSNALDYSELLTAKNSVEYYEAATILKQTKEELVKLPESPKLLHHKKFLDEVNSYFHRWAKNNGISDPLNTPAVKVYKKDKYLTLFKQFYYDSTADPETVKPILNNKDEWIKWKHKASKVHEFNARIVLAYPKSRNLTWNYSCVELSYSPVFCIVSQFNARIVPVYPKSRNLMELFLR